MSDNPLICTNDDCRGKDFIHIGGNKWKCVYCSTIVELQQKSVMTKIRPIKEVLPTKEYHQLTFKCEQCGATIDILDHPRDEKRLNDNWAKHNCKSQDLHYQ